MTKNHRKKPITQQEYDCSSKARKYYMRTKQEHLLKDVDVYYWNKTSKLQLICIIWDLLIHILELKQQLEDIKSKSSSGSLQNEVFCYTPQFCQGCSLCTKYINKIDKSQSKYSYVIDKIYNDVISVYKLTKEEKTNVKSVIDNMTKDKILKGDSRIDKYWLDNFNNLITKTDNYTLFNNLSNTDKNILFNKWRKGFYEGLI